MLIAYHLNMEAEKPNAAYDSFSCAVIQYRKYHLEENLGMKQPLISVCCVAYNHAPYIRQALDGVLMQKTKYPMEVIVHDDRSTDGTDAIIQEYADKYPDVIKPLFEEENQYSKGKSMLLDILFPMARGKYVAWLECDDYWTDPNKLQKQVGYMEAHPECSGTFHAANWLVDEKIVRNDRHFDHECDVTPQQVILGGGEYCASASLVFRTKYAWDMPKFRKIANVTDYPQQILLALRGQFHYFPEIMSAYRLGRAGSWTAMVRNDAEKRYQALRASIRWLEELDRYTEGRYADEIFYKIGKERCVLYKHRQIPFSELRATLDHMKMGRLKLGMMKKCYERYIKYGILR